MKHRPKVETNLELENVRQKIAFFCVYNDSFTLICLDDVDTQLRSLFVKIDQILTLYVQ